MQLVKREVVEALARWHRAYMQYDRSKNDLRDAVELVQASESLAAACTDAGISSIDRDDIDRMVSDGGMAQ